MSMTTQDAEREADRILAAIGAERDAMAREMAAELLTLANVFDRYASGHRAKGTEEGHEKAHRNQLHADRIRALFARARAAGVAS